MIATGTTPATDRHCSRGHALDPVLDRDARGWINCRQCRVAATRRHRERQRLARGTDPRGPRLCRNGRHDLTRPDALRGRQCRACYDIAQARYRERRHGATPARVRVRRERPAPLALGDVCPQGHAITEQTLGRDSHGLPVCRLCRQAGRRRQRGAAVAPTPTRHPWRLRVDRPESDPPKVKGVRPGDHRYWVWRRGGTREDILARLDALFADDVEGAADASQSPDEDDATPVAVPPRGLWPPMPDEEVGDDD